MGWNGKQCQLCGRFANHFYGSQEDDGSTTYADERCLTPAERTFYDLPAEVRSPDTAEGGGMSDDELLETYRAAVNKAMSEAHARDGFASNMSRESIVAGLRAVRAEAVSRANSDAGWALNIDRQGGV